ncbi:hypothetical protein BSKO_03726 [Bryopsis sp. KO-2023]|nr:hypothetical protein BSKO_03726 [Bryopsis sp. KO-2023]
MKLVGRNFSKDGEGYVKLIAEDVEDMWHIYNLIRTGDTVSATTYRKVSRDGKGTESQTIKMKLTVQVEGVEYDGEGGELRLRGRNMVENEHVRLGAYHTIELGPNRQFTINKASWDAMDIDRIRQSTDAELSADLAVVLITEGLAQVCLVGGSTTIQKAKIESKLPRKRGAALAGFDKSWEKFLEKVYRAVIQHINFEVVRCLVIAGPGFTKDQFKKYLEENFVRQGLKLFMENRDRIVVAAASSAYKQSLQAIISSPAVANQIKDTKAAREVKALDDFQQMLADDSSRAFYGPGHVCAAAEIGAVDTLLISDGLFKNSDANTRKKYVKLVDDVRSGGAKVFVFSAAHFSGEQLNLLTGIAAILRYPLPELEDMEIPAE